MTEDIERIAAIRDPRLRRRETLRLQSRYAREREQAELRRRAAIIRQKSESSRMVAERFPARVADDPRWIMEQVRSSQAEEYKLGVIIAHHDRALAHLQVERSRLSVRSRAHTRRAALCARVVRVNRHARVSHRVGVARVARKSTTKSSTADPEGNSASPSARHISSEVAL